MTPDDKALQDLFDTVHYSVELVDTSPDEDEDDPDDDEDYEKDTAKMWLKVDHLDEGRSIDDFLQKYCVVVRGEKIAVEIHRCHHRT